MHKATHTPWFEFGFGLYHRKLLKSHLHGLYIHEDLLQLSSEQSHLLFLNHVSWWDGLLLYQLSQSFPTGRLHVLMGQDGLRQYPFFRRLGAYSVDASNAADVRQMIRYTVDLLAKPGNVVCWFPQGVQRHQEARPLGFQEGLGTLIALLSGQAVREACASFADVDVRAVGLHYATFEDKRFEAYIGGSCNLWNRLLPNARARSEITSLCEIALADQLDEQTRLVQSAFANGQTMPPRYVDILTQRTGRKEGISR